MNENRCKSRKTLYNVFVAVWFKSYTWRDILRRGHPKLIKILHVTQIKSFYSFPHCFTSSFLLETLPKNWKLYTITHTLCGVFMIDLSILLQPSPCFAFHICPTFMLLLVPLLAVICIHFQDFLLILCNLTPQWATYCIALIYFGVLIVS